MMEGTRLNQRGLRFDVSGRGLNEEKFVEENGIYRRSKYIFELELESATYARRLTGEWGQSQATGLKLKII